MCCTAERKRGSYPYLACMRSSANPVKDHGDDSCSADTCMVAPLVSQHIVALSQTYALGICPVSPLHHSHCNDNLVTCNTI